VDEQTQGVLLNLFHSKKQNTPDLKDSSNKFMFSSFNSVNTFGATYETQLEQSSVSIAKEIAKQTNLPSIQQIAFQREVKRIKDDSGLRTDKRALSNADQPCRNRLRKSFLD